MEVPLETSPEFDLDQFVASVENMDPVESALRGKAPSTKKHMDWAVGVLKSKFRLTPRQFLDVVKKVEPAQAQALMERFAENMKPSMRRTFIVSLRALVATSGRKLPRMDLRYVEQTRHREYKAPEISKLLAYLNKKHLQLFVHATTESGLRANDVLAIEWRHIKEDFDKGLGELAIRFDESAFQRRKSPGHTFLGRESIRLLRELVDAGKVETQPKSRIFKTSYIAMYQALNRARAKAGLDRKIQPIHGLRKYFKNALDKAGIDSEKKLVMEGYYATTRSKHYTTTDWEEYRPEYKKAYPHIALEGIQHEDPDRELIEGLLETWEEEKKHFDDERKQFNDVMLRYEHEKELMAKKLRILAQAHIDSEMHAASGLRPISPDDELADQFINSSSVEDLEKWRDDLWQRRSESYADHREKADEEIQQIQETQKRLLKEFAEARTTQRGMELLVYRYGMGEENWKRWQAKARKKKVPLDAKFIEDELAIGEGGVHNIVESLIKEAEFGY